MKKFLLAVLLLVSAALLAGGFLIRQQVIERVEGAYFDAGGVRIHYTDEGEGPPVVLIHGFGANADMNWRLPGITGALARDYRVIALDNRGHGLSDKPEGPASYGMEMVRDVVRLLDHLEIPRAHIIGYSMGGFITMKLLTAHPERIISAAPCGAGWPREDPERRALLEELVASIASGNGISPLIRALDPDGDPGAIRLWLVNRGVERVNDMRALADVAQGLEQLVIEEEELRAIETPVLTIIGTRDPLIEDVKAMEGIVPNHEIIRVDGGDHLTTVRDPAMLAGLRAFLEAHAEAAPAPLITAAAP